MSMTVFLSTPSARRATNKHPKPQQEALHFYPRPPRGGRLSSVIPSACPGTFLSTPSARRATRFTIQTSFLVANISIHALREEGDSIGRLPHRHNRNFYPRPPRGGRPDGYARCFPWPGISIHALREEGDGRRCVSCQPQEQISIHALREEGDKPAHNIRRHSDKHFYPRPPRGGRRLAGDALRVLGIFLSTPSARRATTRARIRRRTITNFYPRPPRGGRHKLAGMVEIEEDFYPRPPRGGRRRCHAP